MNNIENEEQEIDLATLENVTGGTDPRYEFGVSIDTSGAVKFEFRVKF